MARRLVLQQQAEADIDGAMSWYESERSGLGVEFLRDLNVLLDRIEANPFQFPIVHEETRRGMLGRFPYGVFFTVTDEQLLVLAIVHLHRHPDTWKRR
jgi:hypothetical protein